jgi:hypothetical protein
MLTNLKNKMMVVLMAGVLLGLGGCAEMTGIDKSTLATMERSQELTKDNSGIIYGVAIRTSNDDIASSVKDACNTVNNNDARCLHQEDYILSQVIPAAGYNAGAPHITTLIPKSAKINNCRMMKGSDCSFVKIQAKHGEIATFIEVVSSPANKNDNCIWSGMPMIGGTICAAYNWDYRANLNDYSTFFGVLTEVSK